LDGYTLEQAEKLDESELWGFEPELKFLENWNSFHDEMKARDMEERRKRRKLLNKVQVARS
jgi:hypothetical protein